MPATRPPTFRGLPLSTRAYLSALFVVAAGLLLLAVWKWSATDLDVALLVTVAVLCTVGNLFEVFGAGHFSYQPNLAFFLWGAVLLPPWALAPLAVLCFVPGWILHRFRWYMPAFNITNYFLCGLAVSWVVSANDALTAPGGTGLQKVAVLLGAVVTFVALNHLLLGLVIRLTQGRSLRSGLRDRGQSIVFDAALATTGACLAALWDGSPAFVLLIAGPMFLVYRALWLPLLEHKARTDPKTGLYNSDHLMTVFAEAVATARKRRHELSVMMFDLDHLRAVNNRWGHLAGDQLIKAVSGVLAEAAGQRGLAARFGGEEFCLLLPETPLTEAQRLAESIRAKVESMRLQSGDGELSITISIGVAGYPTHGDDVDSLLNAADAAVYDAKLGGRNRVRVPLAPQVHRIFDRPDLLQPQPAPATAELRLAPDRAADKTERAVNGEVDSGATDVPVEQPPEPPAPPPVRAHRRRLVAVYAAFLCAAAAVVGAFSSPDAVLSQLELFIPLVASTVILDLIRIDVFERAKISPASVASIALAILFGPLGPLTSEAAIATLRAAKRVPTVKWTWDFGALSLSGASAAAAYSLVPEAGTVALIAGGIAAGLAYYLVNMTLLSVVMGLSDGRGPLVQWKEGLAWLAPHFAAFGAIAALFVLSEERLGEWALVVFGLPIAMLWIAQKQYVDRSRTSVEELRRNAEQLRGLLADREELLTRMHRSYLSTITSLARTIEAKDPYTGGHTERVGMIARALAARLGFDQDGLRAVEVGAIVHDIGKIGIPDQILLKPGSLDQVELREMHRHTELGSYILADLELPPIVKQMARNHHERYDGSGYPDGLIGEEIPLAARILSVADALDAMTTDRPYRNALPLAQARAEIEAEAGAQFCPTVVTALRECLDEEPAFRALFDVSSVAV
jgi:diguanylate cyclase (GGDEF)-like protein/putative nucleotidyltransferase with HDIG domain